ncbi:MAG: restriction endonuclease subunit S [Cytophagia bacterium]|nr:restriction endonuclease subunit S [Cytophagia bacterium]
MKHSEKLVKIASIRTGYTFRGKIEPEKGGDLYVFQPRDIENELIKIQPITIHSGSIKSVETHVLMDGDLLMPNKGLRFSTLLFRHDQKSIASSSFFVISPDKAVVLPEYLQWFLRQPVSLNYLESSITGSTIPTMTKRSLENIMIDIPSISTQIEIVKKIQLVNLERNLLESLILKRQEYINSFCWELIENL